MLGGCGTWEELRNKQNLHRLEMMNQRKAANSRDPVETSENSEGTFNQVLENTDAAALWTSLKHASVHTCTCTQSRRAKTANNRVTIINNSVLPCEDRPALQRSSPWQLIVLRTPNKAITLLDEGVERRSDYPTAEELSASFYRRTVDSELSNSVSRWFASCTSAETSCRSSLARPKDLLVDRLGGTSVSRESTATLETPPILVTTYVNCCPQGDDQPEEQPVAHCHVTEHPPLPGTPANSGQYSAVFEMIVEGFCPRYMFLYLHARRTLAFRLTSMP